MHYIHVHCVQRAPVCEVSSRPYLFAYCLNTYKTIHYVRFRHCRNATMSGQNALCGRYSNNRRTGKDATNPCTLGLLGHSDVVPIMM